VSGVTLTTQRRDVLALQARLMRNHGATWDRNFDYMNDVDNLERTGAPIVDAGMHHQVCVAMMGLPFRDVDVHTPEFYVNVIRELLKRGVHFDSVCMKDASGTTDPGTCYETAKGLKAILPPEIPLWQHTHDTASMAVACYMAGIEGGVDGIDLSVRPLASGTAQPDVRSMSHALKGSACSLDLDVGRIHELEHVMTDCLREYDFDPLTTTPDARVIGFPMPGGAIGPNVQMMKEAGIADRYSSVLEEFPIVVRAGGAWTSVTPGSQQYWLQAFNNVLYGRWKKIDDGYGRAVLGYFGRTPLPPDPQVAAIAAEQLGKAPFDGDPLNAAADVLAPAEQALRERGLSVTDEHVFLVAASIVGGKRMDLNEGIRFLSGNSRIVVPLKARPAAMPAAPALDDPATTIVFTGPFTTSCIVTESDVTHRFRVTIEPPGRVTVGTGVAGIDAAAAAASVAGHGTPVHAPFSGNAELVDLLVSEGDVVQTGQVVAAVELMKARHEVRAPCAGRVLRVEASLGSKVSAHRPILVIEPAPAS
jgi:pyruvate carboxylase subunit B